MKRPFNASTTPQRRATKAIAVVALALSLLMLKTAASHSNPDAPFQTVRAGSNGQQLVFYDNIGDVYSICVDGHNQNGTYVTNACWGTPNFGRNDPPPGSPHWVGPISIYQNWLTGNTFRGAFEGVHVPRSQALNYWCYDDYNGGGGFGCN